MMASTLGPALQSLRAHRLRSSLTMLGVVIGVAAFMVMVALGNGARDQVAAQIRSLGANLISITPGSVTMGSVRLGSGAAVRLDEGDALAVGREVSGVVAAAPLLYGRAQFTVGSANWAGALRGVTPDYLAARDWAVAAGREITPEDARRSAKVVLLGATLRQRLFGEGDPIGASVRIRDVPFTVVGVMIRKGPSVWGDDQDDVALMPLSTLRRQFLGVQPASPRMIHSITVKFSEEAAAPQVMEAARDLLRQRHRLQPGQDDTFVITDLADAASAEEMATGVVSLLLAAIALVSLVVGGIGIMNITLVSVTERTREIGLRMAVGARRGDILAQFLAEASILSLVGGLIGVVVGIAAAAATAAVLGWPMVIGMSTVLLALTFAAGIGIAFGYLPARAAARLDPIVALRRE